MKLVATEKAPKALGPYSQGYIYNGVFYAAGQIAINPATDAVEADTIEGQTEQVCKNIGELLAAAGTTYDKVIKTTFDLSCLTTTVILSLAILHGFYGIGIGTVFCAFLTGKTVSVIQKFIGSHVEFYRATGKKKITLEKNMRHA